MLTKEIYVDIHIRFKQGQSIRKIARELGVSRNTVKKYLHHNALPMYTGRKSTPSKLDSYKPYLIERINQAKPDWLPATVLFDEVKQRGYNGGIAQLRRFIRQFRQQIPAEPLIRFETQPGQQLQIDFTTIRRGKRPLKAFVATLGFSRACFVKFFDNERSSAWQQGLQEAFEYFGGVTKEVLCDNAKALIIKRDAYAEGEHKLHDEMLQMSKDYGFKLMACKPYRAKTKGKVERFNHYLKNSFILPLVTQLRVQNLELDSDIANAKVGPWLERIAHQRIHGTTQEKPADRLVQEVEYLQPLPVMIQQPLAQGATLSMAVVPPSNVINLQHPMSVYESLQFGEHNVTV
ncbi:IS21 family transposase [Photobacterium damselae subsp. damselae]|uniref:IS21 family transposase n=1 Tax=Photobacterium damselae TaxID=38293 RepID=UPI000A2FB4EB|nr:IS21 family transposase [Photobacterium damselae]ARR50977.1 integrase [Photobacterium damselae subsp. damselae]QAY37234.1 IS21 family transposase [Photobacterium damselae subsp. damselae]